VRLQGDFRVACHAYYHTRFDMRRRSGRWQV
jgi:hypothetical protein